jgi:hypothetical protein
MRSSAVIATLVTVADAAAGLRLADGKTDVFFAERNMLNEVARQLNSRPRKTLDYETPAERFSQSVASTG